MATVVHAGSNTMLSMIFEIAFMIFAAEVEEKPAKHTTNRALDNVFLAVCDLLSDLSLFMTHPGLLNYEAVREIRLEMPIT